MNLPGPEVHIYTPSELNAEAKRHIEAGFGRVWVQGEISNLAKPSSGHQYFTLKDGGAQIRCALFKGSASKLNIDLKLGDEVLVQGQLSLYAPRGDYQLIAASVLSAGSGALHAEFERLKKQLDEEGLFDPQIKKVLPKWPMRIAVVTSPSGAALRDIEQTLSKRWPVARMQLYASSVQGEAAPQELIKALQKADADPSNDLIILARGGGSLEDLWAFNNEALARVLSTLGKPVVTGVGHETDTTIVDFIADYRAPTPTGAVMAATPDIDNILQFLDRTENQLTRSAQQVFSLKAQSLDLLEGRLLRMHPEATLVRVQDRLDTLWRRYRLAHENLIANKGHTLSALARSLNSLSPLNVLHRGYALVTDASGQSLGAEHPPEPGLGIKVRMANYAIKAIITDYQKLESSESLVSD